jgi:hypothetical protein
MADDVKQLLLQVDASVELMRRNLNQGIGSLNQFEAAADRSARNTEMAFSKIDKAAALARASILGFVSGVGLQGLVSLGRGFLQLSDDIATAADQANISVERYQTLREGLRALELSTEQTDNVLKRLTDTLGAVQGGTAAQGVVDALDRMGITSRILNGEISTTDGLLDAIADSAGSFATEAEFTASVVDILGRKIGVDLAAALRDGGAALGEQEQAFRDLGGVIDEEFIKKLADANESIDRFTSLIRARVTITLAEVGRDIAAVGRALSNIGNEDFLTALRRENQAITTAREQSRLNSALDRTGGNSLSAFTNLTRRAPVRPSASSAPVRASAGRASAGRATAPSLSPADQRLQGNGDPGVLAGAAALANGDALLQTFIQIRDLSREISEAEIINPQAQAGAARLSEALAQGIVYGNSIGDALVNAFKAAAAEALASGLFQLLGGNGAGGLFGSILGAFGGARANGGPVGAGRAYLVGERGPELFVPGAAGGIIPNNRLGGGGVQNVNVTVQPSELFVTSVAITAQQAGASAAGQVVRRAQSGRIMQARGA